MIKRLLRWMLAGCASAALAQTNGALTESMDSYRERMNPSAGGVDERSMQTITPGRPGSPPQIRNVSTDERRASLMAIWETGPIPAAEDVFAEIPDPTRAGQVLNQRLAALRADAREERIALKYERVVQYTLEYLSKAQRARQLPLSLQDCVLRALEHNYGVQIERINPAIATTQLIEAQAAFDAEFFLDTRWTNTDQPTAVQLAANQSDQRSISGGFRKLLATGMRAEVSLSQSRNFTDLQFATLNPAYSTGFNARLTQPLLRGFGLDRNRAQINIARADLRISREQFSQRVRDTLLDVERAYWALYAARCNLVISAEAVAHTLETFRSIEQRQAHDATPIELNNSRSRWKTREVEYLEVVRQLRDSEDRLKNLLNDPELLLGDTVELVLTATPLTSPIAIDQFAEVRAALDNRSEVREANLNVEKSRIQTGVAKNNMLPQLDLSFDYNVDGLGGNADNSFDNMTTNRFRSYSVALVLSAPIGNRGPSAAHQRARRQEQQAVLAVQRVMDVVVNEVNEAVRTLLVRTSQIPPQYESVTASQRNLQAFQARTTTISPVFLEQELNTIEQLVGTRRTLVQVVVDYNIAMVELERAKGTLLEFNNVNIVDEPSRR